MTTPLPDELSISPELEAILARRRRMPSNLRDGQVARANKSEIAKKQVLVYLRQGMTVGDAMNAVGRSRMTYYEWCKSTKFKTTANDARAAFEREATRIEMTIAEKADQVEPIMRANYRSWTEYIVAFRKTYFGFDTFDHQWQILEAWEAAPPGGISVILVPPEAGKALALDTPIATPSGWTTMKDLEVGDQVFGADGKPCVVTFKSKVFEGHRCFEVRSDDGASVIADADHLWPVVVSGNKGPNSNRPNYKGKVKLKTTLDLATKRSKQPRLAVGASLDLPDADLPLDPYVLGVWLGDGATQGQRIYCTDEDGGQIFARFRKAGFTVKRMSQPYTWSVQKLNEPLRRAGLLGDKHIPLEYLRASSEQRLALLQGLIDSDGHVASDGAVEFSNTNARLANDVLLLVRSLGVKASLAEGRATIYGRDCGAKYRVCFLMANAAWLPRKRQYCRNGVHRPSRYLSVREVESVPTQCIQVDSPDHLYLAGEGLLVTHNTTLLADTVVADLCNDPNMRRALIGEGQDKASKLMSRIQKRLSTDNAVNSLLYSHFGPFEPPRSDRTKKWNSAEFTLSTSNHDEQDPSIASVGMGSNIRGARWDAVDLDDIQSLKTQSQTQRFLDIFRGDIVTRPGKSGRIRITGSRVCRGDFYEELERLDLIDELVVIPALDLSKSVGSQSYFPAVYNATGERVTNDRDEPLGWTDDEMAQRRKKVGEDMWSRIYMMRPQSDYSSMITEGDIVNATDTHRVPGQPAMNSVATICGLDPSLVNHAAFVSCGYDAEHLYVLDVRDVMRPGTNQSLHAEIRRWTERFRPDTWVIENNTLQRGYLTDDSFLALRNQYGFQSVGHHSGGNKTDIQLGVPAMMEAIVNGQIRFPNIRSEHDSFAMLYDQLMSWRVDIPTRRLTQDLVMALWFCYLRWRTLRQLVEADPSGWRRSGIDEITMYPYARTNIASEGHAEKQRTPMSYDQQWDALRESA